MVRQSLILKRVDLRFPRTKAVTSQTRVSPATDNMIEAKMERTLPGRQEPGTCVSIFAHRLCARNVTHPQAMRLPNVQYCAICRAVSRFLVGLRAHEGSASDVHESPLPMRHKKEHTRQRDINAR